MSELLTQCPHCKTQTKITEEEIGITVECPECHQHFEITVYQENLISEPAVVEAEPTAFQNPIAIKCTNCNWKDTIENNQTYIGCPVCNTQISIPKQDPKYKKLFKQATYPGRDMGIISIITTIGIIMLATPILATHKNSALLFILVSVASLFNLTAIWMFRSCTKKGSSLGIITVSILTVIKIITCLMNISTNSIITSGFLLLILTALMYDLKIIKSLKEKGLFEIAYPDKANPVIARTALGLMVVSLILFTPKTLKFNYSAESYRATDMHVLRDLSKIFINEENAFVNSVKAFMKIQNLENYSTMKKNINQLKQQIEVVNNQYKDDKRYTQLFALYKSTVEEWETGVNFLSSENLNQIEAFKHINNGDVIKQDFNKEYKLIVDDKK